MSEIWFSRHFLWPWGRSAARREFWVSVARGSTPGSRGALPRNGHSARTFPWRSVAVRFRQQYLARLACAIVLALPAVIVLNVDVAQAWKPYTHLAIGDRVWSDVTTHGGVTLTNGQGADRHVHVYAVDPRIVAALQQYRSYYNAGVIGPDAFPDIAFGQAVIHPQQTGEWVRYLYQQAWRAQTLGTYTRAEKGQILAFAYGFMVHAASDMWGHTLINGFAGAVFPDIGSSITDLARGNATRLLVILRHIVSEGYVGDATPGWDTFNADDLPPLTPPCTKGTLDSSPPDSTCVQLGKRITLEPSRVCRGSTAPPGTRCLVRGGGDKMVPDISTTSTPGIPIDVPTRFIYDVLVSPDAPIPITSPNVQFPGGTCRAPFPPAGCPNGAYRLSTSKNPLYLGPQRGPLLDFFLDLEAKLKIKEAETLDRVDNNCLKVFDSNCHSGTVTLTVPTVRGTAYVRVTRWMCSRPHWWNVCIPDPTIWAPAKIEHAYVYAWINDIKAGLQDWGTFSVAVARGLFDPQALRDAQNSACKTTGPQDVYNILRDKCEAGVSTMDAVVYEVDDVSNWANDHLIPMAGFPKIVGSIRHLSSEISDAIDRAFRYLGIVNPIALIKANLKEWVVSQIEDAIEKKYGIDIPGLEQFVRRPAQWFCGRASTKITLLGHTFTPPALFTPADHARMDAYMGMPSGHHEEVEGLPADCGPLNAKFNEQTFAAFSDSVTMSKLAFLDGAHNLNLALRDVLVDQGAAPSAAAVTTYSAAENFTQCTTVGGLIPQVLPGNVLIDTLDGPNATACPTNRGLPWLQLIDGDHAWRVDGLPRFCPMTNGQCTQSALLTGYTQPPFARNQTSGNKDMTNAGGSGRFPLWASCQLRPAFRALLQDWENADNVSPSQRNFPDLGDTCQPTAPPPPPPPPPPILSPFSGTWVNDDPNTGGITRILIAASGSDLAVHPYGKCHPTDCDWGTRTVPRAGSAIYVHFAFAGGLTHDLDLRLEGTALARLSVTDANSYGSRFSYTFHRASPTALDRAVVVPRLVGG